MADTTSAVNGLYATQYGQPAELAASIPSAPGHASTASQSSTTASAAASQKADPQEIGWYFVEQYYTTLSKTPERIHLFYKKKSQLVTGVEAEKVLPAVGEKAISEKIKSLDIRDCKVRVLNVDSQASFSNIVVQVIGELSNKNQPHHKFVQTFVLAEQPNGYFVLNDIFRYLNDEEDMIVEDDAQAEVPASQPATPANDSVAPPTEELVTTETAVEEVDEKLQAEEEEDAEEEDDEEEEDAEVEVETATAPVNGTDEEEPAEEPAAEISAEPTEPSQEDVSETAEEVPSEPAEPEPVQDAAAKASEPAPEAQPVRKTWASMVGGKAPAVPALPAQTPAATQPKAHKSTSQTPAAKPAPTEPAAASPSPTPSNGWQTADHGKKGRSGTQAKAEANVLAYIKNVNEKVDARILREVLEKYGELKYYDVSRQRNCAFVEFAAPEGYAAAVAANPHTVGSETITVEERRPRPNAYGGTNAPFGRGNNQNTRGRGNMQQRTGSQSGITPKDAPRGGTPQQQQRGGKSGNVTPRGRGQPQAA